MINAWQDRPWEAVDKTTGEVLSIDEPPPIHEAAEGFPMASDEAIADLAADILKVGLLTPLKMLDGKLLDGRNRLLACEKADVAPRFEIISGDDPYELAWSFNGERRDLNEVVKYLCWRWCEAGSREVALTRKEVADGKAGRLKGNKNAAKDAEKRFATNDGEPYREEHARRTSTLIAAKLGTGRASVEKGNRIADSVYEPPVRLCRMKVTEALRQIRKAELKDKIAELPDDIYRVIYADPPWQYNDARQTGDHRETTGAFKHYATMSIGEITAMDVDSIAAEDAVLFMWATFPLLAEGLAVVKAWGFNYKTAIVWDKQRSNFGNYHDACAELLMIATRGSCTPEVDQRASQVQAYPRDRHSAKPDEFRKMIDTLYPSGPRIELFRRGDAPEGWDIWGAEADVDTAA